MIHLFIYLCVSKCLPWQWKFKSNIYNIYFLYISNTILDILLLFLLVVNNISCKVENTRNIKCLCANLT